MTPEFKFRITVTDKENLKLVSRFLNAKSAAIWATRLHDEGIVNEIKRLPSEEVITLAVLKKEAKLKRPKKGSK